MCSMTLHARRNPFPADSLVCGGKAASAPATSLSLSVARAALLCALLFSPAVFAADNDLDAAPVAKVAQKISVRGGVHDDANRLVFDWPRNTPYTLSRDGNRVTLTFNANADFDVTRSAQKLTRLGGLSSQQAGGKTIVTFAVDPAAKIQNFLSGTYVVIDVSGAPVDAKAAAEPAKPEPKPEPAKPPVKTETKTEVKPEVKAAAPIPAARPPVTPAPLPNIQPAGKIVAAPAASPSIADGKTPLVTLDVTADAMPVALYARAGDTYMVFDKRVKLKPVAAGGSVPVPQLIDGGSFTAYRFPGLEFPVLMRRDDNVWRLFALPANSANTAAEIVPDAQPGYALGSRMVIPLSGKSDDANANGQVVSFRDPVVGDTLYAVPTAPGQGLQARRYPDFDLLPTWQGVIIRPKNDALVVHRIAEGIELTTPGGVKLSDPRLAAMHQDAQPAAKPSQAATKSAAATDDHHLILDLEKWSLPELSQVQALRKLMGQAAQTAAADPDNRNTQRLELARFYLARGDGAEAAALLQVIGTDDPTILNRPEFLAMRGAAYVLADKPDLALTDLTKVSSDPAAGTHDDINLWRAAAMALQHDDAAASKLFASTIDLLAAYPEPFLTRFSLLATETMLDTGDTTNATKVMNNLAGRTDGLALRKPQALYLRGVLQSRVGTLTDAEALWNQAAASNDELASARARMALINLHVATKESTLQEATTQLERLRFAWRGDDLELSVLERLAQLYEDAGQHEQALLTLDRARKIFPNSSHDADLQAKQQKIFHDMFLGATPDKALSPLKMLAAYNHYKQFLPADPAERQAIAGKLVDQMLQMDLLQNAADMLATQMQDEIDPVKKARFATRIAGIELLNQDNAAAIKMLDASENPPPPADMQAERRLLRARALANQGQAAQAIDLLKDDHSEAARRLVATTAWQAKDWPKAAATLGDLVPAPAAGSTIMLTPAQADIVMNRALALSLAGDKAGLEALGASFGPSMKDTTQRESFSFLTGNSLDTASAPTLAAIQGQTKSVDLFQGVLENYRKAAMPDVPAASTQQ